MQPNSPLQGPDTRNLMLALALALAIMLGWQMVYEQPRLQKAAAVKAEQAKRVAAEQEEAKKVAVKIATQKETLPPVASVEINTPRLHGSISLRGARIEDLTLLKYQETLKKDSPNVRLLSPMDSELPYFLETGMLASGDHVAVPDDSTVWEADTQTLTREQPVTLRWANGQGLLFEKEIALSENYLFTVTMRVKNTGAAAVTLHPYALINRAYDDVGKHMYFMHEGPLGVMNEVLNDVTYKKLREAGTQKFSNSKGWIGLTDKYWLTAIIPDQNVPFDATFSYIKGEAHDRYQLDLRSTKLVVAAGDAASVTTRMFTGAKELWLLDKYRAQYDIPLFDRAVDFGSLYFLTKPFFHMLSYFHSIVGNFGIAILLLTVCIKIVLFPLANKSMTSMSQMKLLTPKMTELRERHSDDKMKLNQEVMAMYKREGVNPMSGCLPILLQIPVFLALYRVLYVTIEMRQAPFYGWIHDLSAPDPTTIFNLFGLINWTPPSFLMIGVWPLIMCATMVLQQRLNPKPTDPVQAAVMSYMPFLFLFMFASFPAGLVIYWAWNNVLSILQQLYINRGLKKKGLK